MADLGKLNDFRDAKGKKRQKIREMVMSKAGLEKLTVVNRCLSKAIETEEEGALRSSRHTVCPG